MPAEHTLHVASTEPPVRYVRGKVADGAGPSVSGVMRLAIEASTERAGRPVAGAAPAAPETRKAVHV